MRILILQQYFYPDLSGNAQYMTDLAVGLAARGHEVTAIASRAVEHGVRGFAPAAEDWSGIRIIRTSASAFGKALVVGRIADYTSYLASAALRALALEQQDVVLALTTPPLLPLVGRLVRFLRNAAFVVLIEDVYPEIAVRAGHLREGSLLTTVLRWFIRGTERSADRIIVIGRCMRDVIVEGGVDLSRIDLITNWADGEAIRPLPPGANPMERELGIEEKFRLVYSGNMGWGHEFQTMLGAAAQLRDVEFLFFGDGLRRGEIAKAARQLPNVQLFPYQPRERLIYVLNLGSVALISQRCEVDGLLVPSKLYATLAAGRPVLFVGSRRCEVGLTVTEERCGFVVAPGDVSNLVRVIERLRGDAGLREEMSYNARAAFERRFQRHQAIEAYERTLMLAVRRRCGSDVNAKLLWGN